MAPHRPLPEPVLNTEPCPVCGGPVQSAAAMGRAHGALGPARQCRACAYDLLGLAPGARCPECGARPDGAPGDGPSPLCEACGGRRRCLGCGYELGGLAPAGQCPECGTVYSPHQLVLHGVVRFGAGPVWRRVAWIGIASTGFGLIQGSALLVLVAGAFIIWSIGLILVIGGAVAMVVTGGARERTGLARIVVGESGLYVCAPGTDPSHAHKIAWREVGSVRLTRVSAVWQRVRLGSGVGGPNVLDAGVRCPDEMTGGVRDTIEGFIRGAHGGAP